MNDDRTIDQTGGWEQSPSVAAATVAAVLARQESEWDRGGRPTVEELLAVYPAFADNVNAVLELVCNEVVLREERGEQPSLSEYQARFPDLSEPLRMQWEVDRVLFSRRPGGPAVTGQYTPAEGGRRARIRTAGTIGRYRVESVLGKGGMGVAYRAWDPDLKRVVAVKTLRADDAAESEVARFRGESAAIARVRHANIVQVFDVGEDAGQPFFAMEFCAGGSLAGRLKGGPLAPDEAAGVVEQIARGVDAAHRQNIVHRDLKPANVLLSHVPNAPAAGASTAEGATTGGASVGAPSSADGPVVYKVTDFGLAKALDADDGQTRTGAIMGTPCYMSPEQAFGHGSTVGPAADVYALGAMLYECLTGRPPFQGATVPDTLEQVRRQEPVPVRRLQPKVPADLETIALKCLQKEPEKRYTSAADAADDLRRFLERRPILARPVGAAERVWRWCRRNPRVAGLIAGVVASLAAGLTGTTIMWRKAVAERKESDASLHQAFGAVNESFVAISDDRLLREPHMVELRKELLARSRPYFESFVAQRRGDPAWKRELALAIARLASVSQLLDPPQVAMEKWRDAVPVWEELLRDDPNSAEAHLELAKVYVSLAYQEQKSNRGADAERALTAALEHLRAVPNRESLGYDPVAFEASALAYLASLLARRGDARATELHRDALRIQGEAARRHPGPEAQLELGAVHFLRGQALARSGDPSAGATELLAAEKLFRAVRAVPCREQAAAVRNLASTLSELGLARRSARALPEAEKALAEAHSLWDGLCKQSPTIADYQIAFSETKYQLAGVGFDTTQYPAADAIARQALALRIRLLTLHTGNLTFVSDVADSHEQVRVIAARRAASADGAAANALTDALATCTGAELNFLEQHSDHSALGGQFRARIPPLSAARARLLARLNRSAEARSEWDRAMRFAPPALRQQFVQERADSAAAP